MTSVYDTTQSLEFLVTILKNISTETTITYTIINFDLVLNTNYDTAAKQEVAISDGDKTTNVSGNERFQVHLSN